MLKRLHVHNFRCLENFTLQLDTPSALLIGANGSGKSTVTAALRVLQQLARGANRVGQLVKPADFPRGAANGPMRFEVEVELDGRAYVYALELELPSTLRELGVRAETLTCDGEVRFARQSSAVEVASRGGRGQFDVDAHFIALPIVQAIDERDPIAQLRGWLARVLVFAPIPSQMTGVSSSSTLAPDLGLENLGDWFTGLMKTEPSAYGALTRALVEVFPDFRAVQNPSLGPDAHQMMVQFQVEGRSLTLPFAALSDGEKCFFIAAMTLAAAEVHGPISCFWDEADAHLALSEVAHLVTQLRRAAGPRLQLVMSSHNPEAIRMFTDESTWLLHRAHHLEPTRVSRAADLPGRSDDLVAEFARGDLRPWL
jgi:predicted ATPase